MAKPLLPFGQQNIACTTAGDERSKAETMACYHCEIKIISRSDHRSATGAAAYRSCSRIKDNRTQTVHDYRNKRGLVGCGIMMPDSAPREFADREILWNAVEASEGRKDSQLAREFELALPKELDQDQQKELLRKFCAQLVSIGMICDVAIHAPHVNVRGESNNNWHAHVLCTMREVSEEGFGKKNRDWNCRANVEKWRESWATLTNQALAEVGSTERVDHRSYTRRGINRLAQVHEGPTATAMKRRGETPERSEYNKQVAEFYAAEAAYYNAREKMILQIEEAKERDARAELRKTEAERAGIETRAANLGRSVENRSSAIPRLAERQRSEEKRARNLQREELEARGIVKRTIEQLASEQQREITESSRLDQIIERLIGLVGRIRERIDKRSRSVSEPTVDIQPKTEPVVLNPSEVSFIPGQKMPGEIVWVYDKATGMPVRRRVVQESVPQQPINSGAVDLTSLPPKLQSEIKEIDNGIAAGRHEIVLNVTDSRVAGELTNALLASGAEFTSSGYEIKINGLTSTDDLVRELAKSKTPDQTSASRHEPTCLDESKLRPGSKSVDFEREVENARATAHGQSRKRDRENHRFRFRQ